MWIIAGLTRLISPPVTMPSSMRHGCLVLASAPVRVVRAVADVHVRGAALSAGRALAQVQVDQMQPAQLANPKAAVTKPAHHEPVPSRIHGLQ